jgi:hypothetical protein
VAKKAYITFFLIILLIGNQCYAFYVYNLDVNNKNSIEKKYFEVASAYYGINMNNFYESNTFLREISRSLKNNTIDAMIISADSLKYVSRSELLNIIKNNKINIKIMIYGISPENSEMINLWSNGSIKNVGIVSTHSDHSYYAFLADNTISRQLSNLSLRNISNKMINFMEIENNSYIESIINFYVEGDIHLFPVFVRKINEGIEFFFLSKIKGEQVADKMGNVISKDRFYELAPMMMFFRYACQERCWHDDNHYANLTIDDPWLHETFGYLSYRDLLREMNKEKFFTSIGFIPWNYDRSNSKLVFMIRNNLNRYSFAIHGDDHNHQEFYPLNKYDDDKNKKELMHYEVKIQQALARMDKFSELTKIPYDRVMIFPHKIAPLYAFSLLKKSGYLATVNSSNVPWGTQEPDNLTNRLRSVTMDFEGFPSYRRKALSDINSDKEYIAIELFLDNPIFLYTHQDYFAENIENFDSIARFINNLQPDVMWGGLGYIIKNHHFERLLNGETYDVLMYANELDLLNSSNKHKKYIIKKKELPSYSRIMTVFVDNNPINFLYDNGYIDFKVTVPKQQKKNIKIMYNDENPGEKYDIIKNNYYYAFLRYISDFRDIYLTKNKYAREFIGYYYNSDQFSTTLILIFSVLCSVVVYILIRIKKIK